MSILFVEVVVGCLFGLLVCLMFGLVVLLVFVVWVVCF